MRSARAFATGLLLLCACAHGYSVVPHPSGGILSPEWTPRKPSHPEDQGVDFYFVRETDGAWIVSFSLNSPYAHDIPVTAAFERTLNQLALRALRFAEQPREKRIALRTTRYPEPLEGTAGEGAEAAMSLDAPPLRVYAAVVRQPGRRYAFVLAGAGSDGGLPVEEARDLARRIRFKQPN
jgi:hypothetical protein